MAHKFVLAPAPGRLQTSWRRHVWTYADGEEQDLAFEGRFGKGHSEGTYECAGGTGKYATATCNGTYESESFPNGMAANRWSGTITFAD